MKEFETICAGEMESRGMMDELVEVKLTRRELYWIRANSTKRLQAAMQGMTAVNARPAKRSERREEFLFHQNLVDRLSAIEPDEEAVKALRDIERVNQAMEAKRKADAWRKRADEYENEARKLFAQ